MTNNNDAPEELRPEAVEEILEHSRTPGEILREARELAGLSVGQVADRLRLRHTQIIELEANEFTKYVSGTYIRGYLRSYAKLLQIDEREVMDAYQAHFADQQKTGSMQTFSNKKNIESQDNRLMIITWFIVLILIGSVAVFVWHRVVEDRQQAANAPSSNLERSAVATNVVDDEAELDLGLDYPNEDMAATGEEEPAVAPNTNAPTNEPTATSPVTPAVVSGANQGSVATTPAATSLSSNAASSGDAATTSSEPDEASSANDQSVDTPASLGELVLVFAGDSWVRIEDASGNAIAYGVKVDGHVMPLNGEAPYQLTLGAPQSVTVYFRGEQVDLSEFRGGRVARFSLPRS